MIDDRNNSVQFGEGEGEYPPPAQFDESASAHAQPVQPIPTGRVAVWVERARQVRQAISGKSRVLVLVIIGGLAIGALGGAMLVAQHTSMADSAPVVNEPTIETTAATDSQKSTDETPAAKVATTELSNAVPGVARFRNRRKRPPVRRAQRAYRVAVIR